jgi:hypothetical protein
MKTQRTHEGWVMVDHRDSPGMGPRGSPLGAGSIFEAATYTCSHCQRVVVVNPMRTRERGYCAKCDARVCDECEGARVHSGGVCVPFERIADEALERAVKGGF